MKPLGLKELEQVSGGDVWIPEQFGFYPRRIALAYSD